MDPERLISDYLDDALSPEEVADLFRWIRSHPDNALQFARAAFLHRLLEHRLSAMRLLQQDGGLADATSDEPSIPQGAPPAAPSGGDGHPSSAKPLPDPIARPTRSRSSPARWRFWSVAAALLLVIGVLSFLVWPRSSPARLLAAEKAVWGSGVTLPKPGDPLPKGVLVLDSGLVQLGFDNGNQVIIEGPARFSITDARALTLERGALTAVVTKAGRGLSVSTPACRVTDLGTEFGVQASATTTRIMVFNGKVSVDGDGTGAAPRELAAGSAIDVSAGGTRTVAFEPAVFKRAMPVDLQPLDLVDLLAGGDGTGSASGVGIDAATGSTRETHAVTVRWGDRHYVPIAGHRVLDGAFIPGNNMPVDSAGHVFTFPTTTLLSYGLIWAGADIPWDGELPIATTLPQDAATPTSRVLVMHSNNGITLNLDAIRTLHPSISIAGFRARVGNSYRPVAPGANPARPLASVYVIVDGAARFEKPGFANVDSPLDIVCPLSADDHFLTLATTDGGDGNACDWVLWTHPLLVVGPRNP